MNKTQVKKCWLFLAPLLVLVLLTVCLLEVKRDAFISSSTLLNHPIPLAVHTELEKNGEWAMIDINSLSKKSKAMSPRPQVTTAQPQKRPSPQATTRSGFTTTEMSLTTTVESVPSRNFLYMLQSESCLPRNLRDANALGDPSQCDCDILVLSYREKCTDSSVPHITYIFNVSTTWTTGRNELYYGAMKLKKSYHFYIIMDDDIRLTWLNRARKSENPWRYFEKFLLRIDPPLAAVDNSAWQLISKIKSRRSSAKCTLNGTDPEYYLAKWFDGEFNAFHHIGLKHIFEPILPHWNRFDKASWWISQWYVNFMTDVVFPKQAVISSQVFGTNPIHRNYPKGLHNANTLKTIGNDVTNIVPPEHREAAAPLINNWVSKYVNILATIEETYCKPIPSPHPKLVPYLYR